MQHISRERRSVYGISLIAAPALLAISTFFWNGTEVGRIAGTIQVYSFIFWIVAMSGLIDLLRASMPRFGAWGLLLAALTCVGGVDWGTDGIYYEGYRMAGSSIPHPTIVSTLGPSAALILFLPGLFFPIALVTLGILLVRSRSVPSLPAILLAAGGVAFPISRIPRIELLAHAADLLLLAAGIALAMRMLKGEMVDRSATVPAA